MCLFKGQIFSFWNEFSPVKSLIAELCGVILVKNYEFNLFYEFENFLGGRKWNSIELKEGYFFMPSL